MKALLLLLVLREAQCLTLTSVVETTQGSLRGLSRRSHNAYLGIPYATLRGRFMAPGLPPNWRDVFNATQQGKTCKQYLSRLDIPIGNENCLSLNVFTPKHASYATRLPIMMFVHGDEFYWGRSSSLLYNPYYLIAKGVIVVTFNYRVGPFGFLCLNINEAQGNAGLKDQIAALEWIRRNIRSFGGDAKKITLFGEGAGAAAVHHLLMSNLTYGLINNAILQSGTALSPFALTPNPIESASYIAEILGTKTTEPRALYNVLISASGNAIVMATADRNITNKYSFRPCIEQISKEAPVITDHPRRTITSGIYNQVPMIIGYNDKEGIYYAGRVKHENLFAEYNNFYKLLPHYLTFASKEENKRVAANIKYFYFNNRPLDVLSIKNLIDYFSDGFFHFPAVEAMQLHLRRSKTPIYSYYFKYSGGRNIGKFISGIPNETGASHTDELFYLFDPAFLNLPAKNNDSRMIEKITTLWTDFAKTSNPTPQTSYLIPHLWINNISPRLEFFNLDVDSTMRSLPNPERMEHWRSNYLHTIRLSYEPDIQRVASKNKSVVRALTQALIKHIGQNT